MTLEIQQYFTHGSVQQFEERGPEEGSPAHQHAATAAAEREGRMSCWNPTVARIASVAIIFSLAVAALISDGLWLARNQPVTLSLGRLDTIKINKTRETVQQNYSPPQAVPEEAIAKIDTHIFLREAHRAMKGKTWLTNMTKDSGDGLHIWTDPSSWDVEVANPSNLTAIEQWWHTNLAKEESERQAACMVYWRDNLCNLINIYRNGLPENIKLVVITQPSGNWGMLATHIVNRTVGWGNLLDNLQGCGSSLQGLIRFLDDDRIVAVSQTSTQAFPHPKLISVPIGFHQVDGVTRALDKFFQDPDPAPRTKEILLAFSHWGNRDEMAETVMANFNHTIAHESLSPTGNRTMFDEIVTSKFILSPSGLGWDCYRNYESYILGAIPVMESLPGLDRTFAFLPTVVVDDFEDVTPELLKAEYQRIINTPLSYWRWEHLSREYWFELLRSIAKSGDTSTLQANHPLIKRDVAPNFRQWYSLIHGRKRKRALARSWVEKGRQ